MSPRVTVVIATYNWSSVLPYSIGSVLEQTFSDFELLVVGDGCTDDSEQVVRGLGDPRVQWINIPRHGHQSGPNNEGIRRARGEYIAYLGHDDLWLPHHLDVHVRALDAGADVSHSVLLMVLPDGKMIPSTLTPSSVAHRRDVIDRLGGWRDYREIRLGPEYDLWLRARNAGMRFALVSRLTGVKMPAAVRRNVYRDRPSHEQASWLGRIRAERDLETTLLVNLAMPSAENLTTRERLLRLARQPWRVPGVVWRHLQPPGTIIGKWKKFKGVRD